MKLFATLRDIAGAKTLDVPFEDGGTVRDLVAAIRTQNPAIANKLLDEVGEPSSIVHIYVRGRNVEWLDGLDTPVKESDILILLPPSAGG